MWDPHTTEVTIVKPGAIGIGATRGWIRDDGTIFSSGGPHDDILQRILNTKQKPPHGSGWIRWIGSVSGTFFLDWSEYGNANSENVARSIVRQVHHPFKQVWIDGLDDKGNWYAWKGSVDDFIKFGPKSRRGEFYESKFIARLEKVLADQP